MRFLVSLRFLPVAISLLGYPSRALAQSTASILAEVPKQDLAQYEGTYHYRDGLTLFMVSNGSQLFALIDDSKYPLRSSGNDAFLNPVGDVVPFVRDSQGHIVAFKEQDESFTRSSTTVPASARLRLQPRATTSKPTPAQFDAMKKANQALYDGVSKHPELPQTPFLQLWLTGGVGHIYPGTEATPTLRFPSPPYY